MGEIKPLYFGPDGQILQAKPTDTLNVPVTAVEVEYVTLMQNTDAGVCCVMAEYTAVSVNSINTPTLNYRKVPRVDCVTLEAGKVGDRVRAAITHGRSYPINTTIAYIDNDLLYLGKNGKLTTTVPSLDNGDKWTVVVGRIVNLNEFIFDPQTPIDLQGGGGSGGGSLPTLIPNTWLYTDGTIIKWKKFKASDIAQDFAITSFSVNQSSLEIGDTFENAIFTFSANDTIANAKLYDSYNDITRLNITSPYLYDMNITRTIASSCNFTLTATDNNNVTTTRSTSISWSPRRYFGSSNIYNLANLSSELSNEISKTFTANCGVGQYIYYIIPTSFGTPIFWVNGFQGGFILEQYIDITNSYGVTLNYQIWKSENHSLGTTTVTVQ